MNDKFMKRAIELSVENVVRPILMSLRAVANFEHFKSKIAKYAGFLKHFLIKIGFLTKSDQKCVMKRRFKREF